MTSDFKINDPELHKLLPQLKKTIFISEGFVCLFNLPKGHKLQRTNVFMFSRDGELQWIIQDVSAPPERERTFVDIYLEDGELKAYNWIGVHGIVNPENGKITVPPQRPW